MKGSTILFEWCDFARNWFRPNMNAIVLFLMKFQKLFFFSVVFVVVSSAQNWFPLTQNIPQSKLPNDFIPFSSYCFWYKYIQNQIYFTLEKVTKLDIRAAENWKLIQLFNFK